MASAEESGLSYRVRTVEWNQARFTYDRPYVTGYAALEPSRPKGSMLVGSFGPNSDRLPHSMLMGKLEYQYDVFGEESDSEFVVTVSVPWFIVNSNQAPCTLLVAIDDGDKAEIPLILHRGPEFWTSSGEGLHFSLPVAVLIDLPEGEHTVRVSQKSLPSIYAILSCGRRLQAAKTEPLPDVSASPDR